MLFLNVFKCNQFTIFANNLFREYEETIEAVKQVHDDKIHLQETTDELQQTLQVNCCDMLVLKLMGICFVNLFFSVKM